MFRRRALCRLFVSPLQLRHRDFVADIKLAVGIDPRAAAGLDIVQEGWAPVTTIISLAHALKLIVVAEGVDTEEQLRLLKLLNCDAYQGMPLS